MSNEQRVGGLPRPIHIPRDSAKEGTTASLEVTVHLNPFRAEAHDKDPTAQMSARLNPSGLGGIRVHGLDRLEDDKGRPRSDSASSSSSEEWEPAPVENKQARPRREAVRFAPEVEVREIEKVGVRKYGPPKSGSAAAGVRSQQAVERGAALDREDRISKAQERAVVKAQDALDKEDEWLQVIDREGDRTKPRYAYDAKGAEPLAPPEWVKLGKVQRLPAKGVQLHDFPEKERHSVAEFPKILSKTMAARVAPGVSRSWSLCTSRGNFRLHLSSKSDDKVRLRISDERGREASFTYGPKALKAETLHELIDGWQKKIGAADVKGPREVELQSIEVVADGKEASSELFAYRELVTPPADMSCADKCAVGLTVVGVLIAVGGVAALMTAASLGAVD